jgi:hypothetical protein
MEMAISIAKVARGNFCTHKSLSLLSTPQTVPITQTLPLLPSMKICSRDESPPKMHPIFSTPCSHACKKTIIHDSIYKESQPSLAIYPSSFLFLARYQPMT